MAQDADLEQEQGDLSPDLLDLEREREEAELDRLYEGLLTPTENVAPPPAPAGTPAARPQTTTSRFEPDLPLPSAEAVFTYLRELTGRSILGGIRDATQEGMTAFAEFIDWTSDSAAKGEWGGLLAEAYMPAIRLATQAKKAGVVDRIEAPKLPEVAEPGTVGGQMTRAVTQFTTAFLGPFKALKAQGIGSFGASMIGGAIADGTAFDPHQKRLANLIEEYPALRNPVTEFLASKPSDSAAMGRFKNALEGAGLGVAMEGFARGLNILRQSRAAQGVTAPIDEMAGTARVTKTDFAPLGDPKGDLITAVEVTSARRKAAESVRLGAVETSVERKLKAAAAETAGTTPKMVLPPGSLLEADGGRGVYINWARIREPEDIKQIIQTAADLHRTGIDEARRGVMTQEATEALADDLGLSVADLLQRQKGEPFNAEKAVAARKLLNVSAEKLKELAKRAASPNAGAVDVFNFRQHMATHDAIQKEVIAARTETARALASWRIPAGAGQEQAKAISAMMDSYGGDTLSRGFARKIAAAADAGVLNSQAINELTRRGAFARTSDALREAWINGILSNPVTHAVNAMSNTAVAINSIVERAAAERVGQIAGSTDGVVLGEAGQMMVGMIEGIKDNWKYLAANNRLVGAAKRTLGLPGRIPDTGVTFRAPGLDLSKLEMPIREAITAENVGLRSDTFLGAMADGFGTAVRTPGSALEASDQMFKTLGYRMELHALALRTATQEGLQGTALKKRMARLVANPPQYLRMQAVDNALYQTFTNQLGEFGRGLMRLRDKVPGGFLLLPFVRTPANILKYSFARTPLAPLMSQVRADMGAGGARAQLAYTRMALGTAAQLTTLDLVYSGIVSGNGPPDGKSRDNLLAQGWQPYSIKIDDRWDSYQRLDPANTIIGTAADIAEFTLWAAREQEDPEALDQIYAAGTMALANTLVNKTYLSTLADFFAAARDPDQYGRNLVNRLAGSVVPAGVAQATRVTDPYLLEVRTRLDAIKSRTPGWSKELPAVRDRWGREIEYRSGLGSIYDALSPIYSRREKPSPIDKEMERLRTGAEKPNRLVSFDGVTVNLEHFPWVYDRYVELAGNGYKEPAHNLGAHDYLNALVEGQLPESEMYKLLDDGPDGGKARMIGDVIAQFRGMARVQLLDPKENFPALRALVDRKRVEQQARQLQALSGAR